MSDVEWRWKHRNKRPSLKLNLGITPGRLVTCFTITDTSFTIRRAQDACWSWVYDGLHRLPGASMQTGQDARYAFSLLFEQTSRGATSTPEDCHACRIS